MNVHIEELKKLAIATGAGKASYTFKYEDGGTIIITYKLNKRK